MVKEGEFLPCRISISCHLSIEISSFVENFLGYCGCFHFVMPQTWNSKIDITNKNNKEPILSRSVFGVVFFFFFFLVLILKLLQFYMLPKITKVGPVCEETFWYLHIFNFHSTRLGHVIYHSTLFASDEAILITILIFTLCWNRLSGSIVFAFDKLESRLSTLSAKSRFWDR